MMEIDHFFPLLSFFFVSRNLFNKSTNRVRFSTIAVSNNSDFSPSLPPSPYGKLYAYDCCSAYASLSSLLFDEANKELEGGIVSGWRLFRDVDVYDGCSLRLAG